MKFIKKIFKFIPIAFLSATILAGCSQDTAEQQADTTAQPEPVPVMIDNRYVADENYTDMQLADPTIPMYDRYTLEERIAGNMPRKLPELTPYQPAEGEKIAYLTFDDGPDTKVTVAILDVLKEHGVPATFYVTGLNCEAHPDILKRIYDEHHAIGNHSYSHVYKELYNNPNDFLYQMNQTDEIIKKIIGVRPMILRAPGGGQSERFNTKFRPVLTENGYVEHDWNSSCEDATGVGIPAKTLIKHVNNQTGDKLKSAIILMHCNQSHMETAKALPEIIRILKEKGYKFGVVTPMTPQPI